LYFTFCFRLFKYKVSFPRYFTVCITYQPPLVLLTYLPGDDDDDDDGGGDRCSSKKRKVWGLGFLLQWLSEFWSYGIWCRAVW